MRRSNKFRKDEHAIELPINIVVMLVVGMVALAALLAIIPKSKESLSVDIINVTIGNNVTTNGNTAKIIGEGEHQVKVRIKVYDRDNNPVQKASATMSGGGGFGTDQTDSNGEGYIILGGSGGGGGTMVTLKPNQQMLELKLIVKANGFYDYEDQKAVLLYQTRK
ncbi:MAG: carboxypeptidase regulatory-like domain-containing protein [Euryarchaeota archaeon]|nr:carboxypeptidase regulatory-like domain-containing protein [Euryarchaeota archaeon]MBU4222834.1 carboxypeptidase regulatory-like domain-containing protein [Euryarchaeota archaeon]MBU4340552.1 carboxypeptidase regulatory-like domain-containing protein [Euryarchaeota archaeon]